MVQLAPGPSAAPQVVPARPNWFPSAPRMATEIADEATWPVLVTTIDCAGETPPVASWANTIVGGASESTAGCRPVPESVADAEPPGAPLTVSVPSAAPVEEG